MGCQHDDTPIGCAGKSNWSLAITGVVPIREQPSGTENPSPASTHCRSQDICHQAQTLQDILSGFAHACINFGMSHCCLTQSAAASAKQAYNIDILHNCMAACRWEMHTRLSATSENMFRIVHLLLCTLHRCVYRCVITQMCRWL